MASFVSPLASSLKQHRSPFAINHGCRPVLALRVVPTSPLSLPTTGVFPLWKLVTTSTSILQCNAKRNEDHVEDETYIQKETIAPERVRELVESIKYMLQSMDGGAISSSAYDTAWVAMVKDIRGSGGPQFTESLDWILNNQLADGSWGDNAIFMVYDRILNTLACVVALKSWNMHPDKMNRGILFIKQNIQKLENEDVQQRPSGFEVVVPALLEMAKKLKIDTLLAAVNSHGFMKDIYAERDLKLKTISKEMMHKVPTSLLLNIDDTTMGFRLMRMHGYDISTGVFPVWKPVKVAVQCNAVSRSPTEERMRQLVESIASMLRSMGDGEISVSPYDTAWVALVEDIEGGGGPEFPASVEWISSNQLVDGSWGDATIFSIYDRILNTLACVVALRSWNIHPDKADKGILFIQENIHKLGDENEEHMPIGFEVALPSLIEIARKLEIHIPEDSPGLRDIYAKRELKLSKIPREVMHKMPTTLLHSMEGMGGLMWEKLLKFQGADGSFLFSPSSTAFALDQTKDEKCLKYIQNCVHNFNGGVPNVYPVDLFEHIWAVDRLQRLGISRYFQPEIDECIDYVHKYWTNKGICWARNSQVQDIDDTAMGFRLMRMHGYDISADVFENFKKGGEFFCFPGQSTQAVTGMYNLYRASQVKFPGEHILCDAADCATDFLMKKRAENALLDKWIITKDLPGEVGYALDVPLYASLPRLEARYYVEQYGGEDDIWIGKTLYRMPYVNNNTYLELAKLDYNKCQSMHLKEWKNIKKWYRNNNLGEFGLSERSALQGYYIAAASIFEPEKREERLTWAKTTILVETIISYFEQQQLCREQERAFVKEFEDASILKYANGGRYKTRCRLVEILSTTLNQLSMDILMVHGQDIHLKLSLVWHKWLKKWEEGDAREGDAELFVRILNLCGGVQRKNAHMLTEEVLLFHPKYEQLLKTTKTVCHQLRLFERKKPDCDGWPRKTSGEIELNMQELAKLVFTKSPDDLDSHIKQNFLTIAKSFYYASYFSPMTINSHIDQVLFERVLCSPQPSILPPFETPIRLG